MATIKTTVNRVQIFTDENRCDVRIGTRETFPGYVQDADGTRTETNVSSFSLGRSRLTAQLCEASDEIAMYRIAQESSFTQKQLAVLLFGATLTIERKQIAAGETLGEGDDAWVAEQDCYITNIVGVKLTEKALERIDRALEL